MTSVRERPLIYRYRYYIKALLISLSITIRPQGFFAFTNPHPYTSNFFDLQNTYIHT